MAVYEDAVVLSSLRCRFFCVSVLYSVNGALERDIVDMKRCLDEGGCPIAQYIARD